MSPYQHLHLRFVFRLPQVLRICVCFLNIVLLGTNSLIAQDSQQMVRIAKIDVDPQHLDPYLQALHKQMSSAVRLEKGVLSYHAVADKANPARITILEVYADTAAYESHIRTPHFLEYKERVKDWVRGLELVDVQTVAVYKKPDQ